MTKSTLRELQIQKKTPSCNTKLLLKQFSHNSYLNRDLIFKEGYGRKYQTNILWWI